jgi:NhaP-type Na+/H+ or K+/H+ antiporter
MLTAWFGIRGLGSIYYLCHAIGYGLPHELAEQLSAIVLITVAASVVIHGISVQPLLQRYRRSR